MCGQNHILGDGAYPIMRWLLKPYRDTGNLTRRERRYNKVLSQMRSGVERAFGALKNRFKRLRLLEHVHIEDTNKTILATCVIHNICIMNDDLLDEMIEEHVDVPNGPLPQDMFDADVQAAGSLKRMQITRLL